MKICSTYCLALSLCLLSLALSAQQVELIDVVHLINGEIVEGKVITFIPEQSLTLRNEDGIELTYPVDQIERVVQVDKNAMPTAVKKPIQPPKEKGFYNLTHVGLLNGQGQREFNMGFSIHNVTGYLFKRWLGIGIGGGVDNYSAGVGETIYPIFAEVRGYLQDKPNSFFYAVQGGYGMAFPNRNFFVSDAEGGLMYQTAIGYRIATKDALQLLVTLGTRFQTANFVRQEPLRGGEEVISVKYQRLAMGVGILF